jgi:multidrug efflux pump subunit AcrA (membrane-fusion protein)
MTIRLRSWLPHLVAILLGTTASLSAQAPKVPPPPKVLVTPIIEKTVAAGQTFVGTVKPLRKSIVGSAVAGRVEEYLVNEGDRVKKGQPIAKLRTGIIQAELDAAAAELKVRQAELNELENGARPAELDQAKARLAMAEANRAFRQANRSRTSGLGLAISREKEHSKMQRRHWHCWKRARVRKKSCKPAPGSKCRPLKSND